MSQAIDVRYSGALQSPIFFPRWANVPSRVCAVLNRAYRYRFSRGSVVCARLIANGTRSGDLALQRGAGLSDLITPVGQDRQILTRSGSGDPELQKWARCPNNPEEIRGAKEDPELQRWARCAAPPRFSIGIRPPPKGG